jgi:hypothetical protein
MGWLIAIFAVLAMAFALFALSKFSRLDDRLLPDELRSAADQEDPSVSFVGGVRWKGGGSASVLTVAHKSEQRAEGRDRFSGLQAQSWSPH